MKRVACLLPILATACGETEGKRLEPIVRAAVGWPAPTGEELTSPDSALRNVRPSPEAWLSTDPGAQALAEQSLVEIHSRRGGRGGAGVLVRWKGGRFRVEFEVKCERMDWSTALNVGLFPLGGWLGADRPDPALFVQLGASGGEGDVRHFANLQAYRGEPRTSDDAAFPLRRPLQVVLSGTAAGVEAELRLPQRRDPLARWQTRIALPHGLYLLGSCPREGDAGVVEATVRLVVLAGDIEPVSRSSPGVPPFLRTGVMAPESRDDVVGRVAHLLNEPTDDWQETSAEARRWINRALSLGIIEPSLDAWLDRAAVRNAGAAERQASMIGPMADEVSRTIARRAPLRDERLRLEEWAELSADLDLVLVQVTALRVAEYFAQTPPRSTDALVAAFRYCKCSYTAHLMVEHLENTDPAFPKLVEYARSPQCDARVAWALAHKLATSDVETARLLCKRALDEWICDRRLGNLLSWLNACDLLARWHELRANRPAVLRAALVRQRWMGLGNAAVQTALALLDNHLSLETVRACAPVLCLARDGLDMERLAKLLADPDLCAATRQALLEDPFLVAHREEELRKLGVR